MTDPYAAARRALEETAFGGPGHSAASVRKAVAKRAGVPAELEALVEKIEKEPWKVSDGDIAALRAKYSEDEIFEIVVCTAIGAAQRRLDAGLAAIDAVEKA